MNANGVLHCKYERFVAYRLARDVDIEHPAHVGRYVDMYQSSPVVLCFDLEVVLIIFTEVGMYAKFQIRFWQILTRSCITSHSLEQIRRYESTQM